MCRYCFPFLFLLSLLLIDTCSIFQNLTMIFFSSTQGWWSSFRRNGTRLPNITRRRAVPEGTSLRGIRSVSHPHLQLLRSHSHRELAKQYIRVQGLQKQDADIADQTAVRGEAVVPGVDGYEHCAATDGPVKRIEDFRVHFLAAKSFTCEL